MADGRGLQDFRRQELFFTFSTTGYLVEFCNHRCCRSVLFLNQQLTYKHNGKAYCYILVIFISGDISRGQCTWISRIRTPRKNEHRSGNFLVAAKKDSKNCSRSTRLGLGLLFSVSVIVYRPSLLLSACSVKPYHLVSFGSYSTHTHTHDHLAPPSTITVLPRCLAK
jgi:hypothetical protein